MIRREVIAGTAAAAAGLGMAAGVYGVARMNPTPDEQNAALVACYGQIDNLGLWGWSVPTLPDDCQPVADVFATAEVPYGNSTAPADVSTPMQTFYEIPDSGTAFVSDNLQSRAREDLVVRFQDGGAIFLGGVAAWAAYGIVRKRQDAREEAEIFDMEMGQPAPLVSTA